MKYIVSFLFVLLCFLVFFGFQVFGASQKSYQEIKTQFQKEIPNSFMYTQAVDMYILALSFDRRKLHLLLHQVSLAQEKRDKKKTLSKNESSMSLFLKYVKERILLHMRRLEKVSEIQKNKIENITNSEISPEFFEETPSPKNISEIINILQDIYKIDALSLEKKIQEVSNWNDPSQEKQRDLQRKTDLEKIQKMIETYKKNNGKYPTYTDIVNIFARDFPKDPLGGLKKNNCRYGYFYEVWGEGTQYRISTCIESNEDTSSASDGGIDNNRYEIGSDVSYEGKGVSYTNNSDIFYFSLVDQKSEGGSIHNYSSWAEIPLIGPSPSEYDRAKALLQIEYEKQNPWKDTNIVTYNIINMIASAVDNYFLNGDILELIYHDSQYESSQLTDEENIIGGQNYKVGTINYEKLGLKKDFPKDSIGEDFLLSYANMGWGSYQILGKGYEFSQGSAYQKIMIRGTYTAKNQTLLEGTDYKLVGNNSIQLLDPNMIYLFYNGGFINAEFEVTNINYETNILSFSPQTQSLREIVFDEPAGLIFDPLTNRAYIDGK